MARAGVIVVGLCLILYFVLTGQWSYLYLSSGEPIGIAMGVALIVLPLIGAWALVQRYTAEAEASAADWRARYRLGVVQDAAGRRKDARASIREAIRLAKVR